MPMLRARHPLLEAVQYDGTNRAEVEALVHPRTVMGKDHTTLVIEGLRLPVHYWACRSAAGEVWVWHDGVVGPAYERVE
jgi:hypothetical protein